MAKDHLGKIAAFFLVWFTRSVFEWSGAQKPKLFYNRPFKYIPDYVVPYSNGNTILDHFIYKLKIFFIYKMV